MDDTEGSLYFQVIGVDYTGPTTHKMSKTKEVRAHMLLFASSLTRAVHIELLSDQATEGFVRCLKRIIARRGGGGLRKYIQTMGEAKQTFSELEEKILDVEVVVNNRPLTYVRPKMRDCGLRYCDVIEDRLEPVG